MFVLQFPWGSHGRSSAVEIDGVFVVLNAGSLKYMPPDEVARLTDEAKQSVIRAFEQARQAKKAMQSLADKPKRRGKSMAYRLMVCHRDHSL